jgi:hypothetical protein
VPAAPVCGQRSLPAGDRECAGRSTAIASAGHRDLVRCAGAYDINRIRFRNPFIPLLRFTVGTGLEIVWRHQRRHLLQAERIKQPPHVSTPVIPKLRSKDVVSGFSRTSEVRLKADTTSLWKRD